MPFLAPLIPLVMTIGPEIGGAIMSGLGTLGTLASGAGALVEGAGGLLAPGLLGAGEAMGLPLEIAAPLSTFLSPEIIGGGLGAAFGGTKGLEEGLLGGLTLGGGGGALGQLLGNVGADLGAGGTLASGVGDAAARLAPSALQLASGALNAPPSAPTAAPVNTITPAPAAPGASPLGGGGALGLNISGNTAPQVGPWRQTFWGNAGGSTPSAPMVGTGQTPGPAAATGSSASATQQQQFVPSP